MAFFCTFPWQDIPSREHDYVNKDKEETKNGACARKKNMSLLFMHFDGWDT